MWRRKLRGRGKVFNQHHPDWPATKHMVRPGAVNLQVRTGQTFFFEAEPGEQPLAAKILRSIVRHDAV